MSRRSGRVVAGCLVVVVGVLAGVVVGLAKDSSASSSPMAECRDRTSAWAAAHGALYAAAGSPAFVCESVPFTGWHSQWVGADNQVRINVRSLEDDATLDALPVERFYSGLLWHEMGHAYGDATGSYLGREGEYAALRPEAVTGFAPVEDYAFTFAWSFGHYDSWHACARCPGKWTPPTSAELAVLRARGFLPSRDS